MKPYKSIKYAACAAILAVLMLGMIIPTMVFADSGAPVDLPESESPGVETTDEASQANTTETASGAPQIEATEMPPEAPGESEPVNENPAPANQEAQPRDAGQVIQAIPEGTGLLVLDENGEVLPLASEEALDTIAKSDPVWCPAGVMPGGASCTEAVSTITDLLPLLAGKSGAGTIYFTVTYDTNDVTLNQNENENLSGLTDLTLQGGWNGSLTSPSILDGNGNPGRTEISTPITIDWNYGVSLNDITVQLPLGSEDTGISIDGSASEGGEDILLNNVTVNNANNGVRIQGARDVTMKESEVKNSESRGIDVRSVSGTLTLQDSDSFGNGEAGLVLQTIRNVVLQNSEIYNNNKTYAISSSYLPNIIYDAENVTLTNSSFHHNDWYGLVVSHGESNLWSFKFDTERIYTPGVFTINGSIFNNNDGIGLDYEETSEIGGGALDFNAHNNQRSEFNENNGDGLQIIYADLLDINGADFFGNRWNGMAVTEASIIKLADLSATYNNHKGIHILEVDSININGTASKKLIASNNGRGGISVLSYLDESADAVVNYLEVSNHSGEENGASFSFLTNLSITNSTFSNNGYGLMIYNISNAINLSNLILTENNIGAFIYNEGNVDGDLNIADSAVQSNEIGIYGFVNGDVDIRCIDFKNNSEGNLGIFTPLGNITLKGIRPDDEGVFFETGEDIIYLGDCTASTCCPPSGGASRAMGGRTVQVSGGENVGLSCDYSWTALQLPNLDKVTYSGICGANIQANLKAISGSELPAPLPVGMILGSSLVTNVNTGSNILPSGAYTTITFHVPEELKGKELAILFWDADAGTWIEIPMPGEGEFNPSNAAMQLLAGMTVNSDGTVTMKANFTGSFVLVGK